MKARGSRYFIAVLLILALSLNLAGTVLAVAPDSTPNAGRKIVVFQADVTGQAAHDQIVASAGAQKIKDLPLINATVVMAAPANENALRRHAGVLRVDDDGIVTTQDKPVETGKPAGGSASQPNETLPWGVDRIDAEKVWTVYTWTGAKVAVLDTGIDLDHPDLAANVKGGINTVNSMKTPDDDNGHGSHVAGIIAGVDNSIGVIGVAPEASLYAVKVLNRQGWGYISDIIDGLDWSIKNGIQVVNMSFGSSSDNASFHNAITAAAEAGIVLVAAAGNSGPGDNTVDYPGAYPEVIAVAATDSSDGIASFSSRGPQVDLAAPGVGINSTYKNGGYRSLSGTSMASPHVAGAAALVIGSGRASGNAAVRAVLEQTADDLGAPGLDSLYGHGLVDAEQAVTGTQTAP